MISYKPKIHIISFNSTLDLFINTNQLNINKLNRYKEQYLRIGGKGINIAKVLSTKDCEYQLYTIIGGNNGNRIKDYCNIHSIKAKFVETELETPINIKIINQIDNKTTELNHSGIAYQKKILIDLENLVLNNVNADDYCIITGNIPKTYTISDYCNFAQNLQSKNIKLVIDANGKILKDVIKLKPFLIKPNIEEVSEMLEIENTDLENIISNLKDLLPTETNVLLSLGDKGIVYMNKTERIKLKANKINVINTVGAGDNLLASFIFQLYNRKNISESLNFAKHAAEEYVTKPLNEF